MDTHKLYIQGIYDPLSKIRHYIYINIYKTYVIERIN